MVGKKKIDQVRVIEFAEFFQIFNLGVESFPVVLFQCLDSI
jgi:hypothetical protein